MTVMTKNSNNSPFLSDYSDKKIAVIIAAAGSSTRMGGTVKKEYLPLNEGTVLSQSAKTFLKSINCAFLVITVPENGEKEARKALFSDKEVLSLVKNVELNFVEGSSTRQKSIYNALTFLAKKEKIPDIVLIHDGARPFISSEIIKETAIAAFQFGGAVPGITPTDTQKIKDENGFIKTHLTRSTMTAVQTPQGFEFAKLLDAHEKASKEEKEFTDDTEIYGIYAGKVKITEGSAENIKITYPQDYKAKENNNSEKSSKMNIKIGLGYDLHRLEEGRSLIIGGVKIPFEKGESGHSDGDALLHAITDALLGASGLGDIGSYFPPEEAKWKDADSAELLKKCWTDVKNAGWNLGNLDCVIKLEKPKLLPYRNQIITSIAKILETDCEKIFVKAKTGEKLESVGQGKAIEVWTTCLLTK